MRIYMADGHYSLKKYLSSLLILFILIFIIASFHMILFLIHFFNRILNHYIQHFPISNVRIES